MENPIQIFNHEQFGHIRTVIGEDGEPRFCLIDVCKALGLTSKGVNQRLAKEVISNYPLLTAGGKQNLLFVNEDGLYDTILESRKPEAKVFRKWVTSEVLPCIRKNGGYIMVRQGESPEDIQARALRVADHAMKVLEEKNEALICEVERQQGQIEDLKVRTVYQRVIENSPGLLTPTQIAKDYGMSGKKFNKILHELGIQYYQSGQWLLYAKYQDYGYTKSVTYLGNDGETYAHTKWTQKGRFFLYKALRNECILPLCEIM